jgi:hypothetical protein
MKPPILPIRFHGKGGRLSWRRCDVEAILGVELPEYPLLLETSEVAKLLRRRPQTLRIWAMSGSASVAEIPDRSLTEVTLP